MPARAAYSINRAGGRKARPYPNALYINNMKSTLRIAAILGALGVGLGAFGAHGLAKLLAATGHAATWETAARYHLLHALALLAVGLWQRQQPAAPGLEWAARCFGAGVVLFSGSLYALSLTQARWLGPVTPLGGALLIAGWLLLARAAGADTSSN